MIKKEILKAKPREVIKKLKRREFSIDERGRYNHFDYGYPKGQKDLLESFSKEERGNE